MTTDKNKRKAGLGKDLLRRSVDLAKVLGFKAVKTEATGEFSIDNKYKIAWFLVNYIRLNANTGPPAYSDFGIGWA